MDVVGFTSGDIDALVDARRRFIGDTTNPVRLRQLAEADALFGVLCYQDGELVGYRCQQEVADRISGFGTMAVAPEWRGRGIGRFIVDAHHELCAHIDVFMVFNSDPRPAQRSHVPAGAEQFWKMCGYRMVTSTPHSRVLVWERQHTTRSNDDGSEQIL